jgi:transcriptional regulator with XRE-family HTH domain
MPGVNSVTPNQLVARNLRRARDERGWSQTEAVRHLSQAGLSWSKTTLSEAEQAATKAAGRAFSADELVGMARTFNKPVTWFFMPEEDGDYEVAPKGADPEPVPAYLATILALHGGMRDRVRTSAVVGPDLANALEHEVHGAIGRGIEATARERGLDELGQLVQAAARITRMLDEAHTSAIADFTGKFGVDTEESTDE